MLRLTQNPWFGPRRTLGWGWKPITWQGWAVSLGCIAAILACALAVPGVVLKIVAEVVLVLLLLLVCFLTGTKPGWKGW
jgi:hypothetical protein